VIEKKKRRVVVVSPVHNRKDLTLMCLRSLGRADKSGIEMSIIIVDDGSTDSTEAAIADEFPEVRVIRGDGNLWFTGGMNVGLRAALDDDPDYILAINNDTVFDDKFLVRMVECAENNPRSVVGALLLLWDEPHKVFQVAPSWDVWSGGFRHWQKQTVWTVPERPWEVELIVGNCVLFPVAAIRECGLMLEDKLPHYGDAEYTPRMRRRGWKLLIEPGARAFCQPNTPPPSLRKMAFGEMFRTAFLDLGNANSVRRRFYANWYGAPNKIEAVAALPIFYIRYLLGKNIEGNYSNQIPEPTMKEMFSNKVVEGGRSL